MSENPSSPGSIGSTGSGTKPSQSDTPVDAGVITSASTSLPRSGCRTASAGLSCDQGPTLSLPGVTNRAHWAPVCGERAGGTGRTPWLRFITVAEAKFQ